MSLLIHLKELELAKDQNKKITNEDVRHYNNTLFALKEGAWGQRLGSDAISTAKGLQRLILIKSLEREQKNPHRESYF